MIFKYLGALITDDNRVEKDIWARITVRNRVLMTLLRSKPLKDNPNLHCTVICLIVTYEINLNPQSTKNKRDTLFEKRCLK